MKHLNQEPSLTAREWLNGITTVAGRELAAYFDSSIAYVHTIAFLVLANSQFMNDFFLTGTDDMTAFFQLLPLLLAFFVPAITMRLWAEERKTRTVEVLLTLPLLPAQAVVGKFLAALLLFGVLLVGTLPIPVMLVALGHPDLGLVGGGYLGALMLGSLLLAWGMLMSAVSADQIVAFVLGAVGSLGLVLTGHERVVAVLDGLAPALGVGTFLLDHVSAMPHYESFERGVVGLDSLAYFGLLSCLCLWLNVRRLETDRV